MRCMKAHFCVIILFIYTQACLKKTDESQSSQAHEKQQSVDTHRPEKKTLQLVDPETPKVMVSTIELKSSIFSEKKRVPTFDINFTQNNYVMILRCRASYYHFIDEKISAVANDNREARKWNWFDAFGDQKNCSVISTKTMARSYQDFAAPLGKHFYIINPCVSANLSTTASDECSHYLSLTNEIEVESSLTEEYQDLIEQLNRAESEYDATVSEMALLTQRIYDQKDACLDDFSQKVKDEKKAINQKNRQQAWTDIGVLVGAFVVAGASGLAARSLAKSTMLGKHPFLTGGAAFAAVSGIYLGVTQAQKDNGFQANYLCPELTRLSEEMLAIKDSQKLENSMNKIIAISKKITEIDQTFTGYNEKMLGMSQ